MQHLEAKLAKKFSDAGINWLIIGACTGTQAEMMSLAARQGSPKALLRVMPLNNRLYTFQPKMEWVQEIVDAADKAGIPVFLKENLAPLIVSQNASSVERLGIVMRHEDETILDLGLRQEFPNG